VEWTQYSVQCYVETTTLSTTEFIRINNPVNITVSHGSAYTVIRATQQVNGKWQFWGCQNSVTPQPID